jgi:peptide/nickel transport system ATP-binding protein
MGEDIAGLDDKALRARRQDMQIIFQDPIASLNPRMTVGDIIAEPLKTFFPSMSRLQIRERVTGILKLVGLRPDQINRYPHEFSGGQCQRIGIARSLVLNPRLLICDEPVSALDVSVQAQVLNLLADLKARLGLTYIFISHDLAVVEAVSDRIAVLYFGSVVELGRAEDIFRAPRHPYTKLLADSAPVVGRPLTAPEAKETELPDPLNPPTGCAFRARCPRASDRCAAEVPVLTEDAKGQAAACFHPLEG